MTDPVSLVYFDEVLAKCFAAPEPPHQILSYCFRRLLDFKPSEIAGKFADPAAPWSLDRMTDFFAAIYAGTAISSYRMRRMMGPLRERLRMPLSEAVVEENWRQAHEALLELHGSEICGRTTLRHYDTGRLIAQLVPGASRTANDCAGPVECLGCILRGELGLPYSWVIDRADTPLHDLCPMLDALYEGRNPPGKLSSHALLMLSRNEKLREYETTHLAADISRWVWTFEPKLKSRCQ